MEPLIVTAGLLAVGTITPGPNNLIVLQAAARHGRRDALRAGLGIVAGGLVLLLAAAAGAGRLLSAAPESSRLLSAVACLALAGLGAAVVGRGLRSDPAPPRPATGPLRGGAGGPFLFQLVNPKAWIVVVAAVSSLGPGPELAAALPSLVALFVLIPAASLTLWALAGMAATRALERPRVRAWFDRLTGALLVGFAVHLLLGGIR